MRLTQIKSIQTSSQSQATSGADCRGQSVSATGYGRYGNLLTINASPCSSLILRFESLVPPEPFTTPGLVKHPRGSELVH